MHASGPASAVRADLDSASVDLDAPPKSAPSAAPLPPHLWAVLRHRHYRTIWSAAFFSNVGNWMEVTCVMVLVARQTNDVRMAAAVGIAATAPILAFGLFGGLAADRMNRRTLLFVTQMLMMLIAAAMTVVSAIEWPAGSWGQAYWIIGLTAVNGVAMAFNMPAWQVLVPRLVPKEDLFRAITLNGIQFNMSRIVGPLLAGSIMVAWGAPAALGLNTLSFLIVALAVLTTPDAPAANTDLSRPWAQIGEALKYIFTNRAPRAIFLAIVCCSALAAPLIRLFPQFSIDVYGHPPQHGAAGGVQGDVELSTTYLTAILGIGAVIGGLSVRYIPAWYPRHHFIPMSVSGLGLLISVFALVREEWVGCLVMLPAGVFWVWAFNQTWAAAQSIVPDHLRGRVMAVAGVASFGATGLGFVIAGGVSDVLTRWGLFGMHASRTVGTQASVLALSMTLLCAGVVMLLWRTPEIDGMPRPGGGAKPNRNIINALLATEHHPSRRADGAEP